MPQSITIRFDKEADDEAKKGTEPIFNTDGKPVVMGGLWKRRISAQMKARAASDRMKRLLDARGGGGSK